MTDNLPPLQHHLQNFLDCLPGSEKQEITEAIQLYASTAIDAALVARGAVPAGWVIFKTSIGEIIVQAPNADPGGMTLPAGPGGSLSTRILEALCRDLLAAAPQQVAQPIEPFQPRVKPWLLACFGEMIAGDKEERNHRFLEEALELVQACGCTEDEAIQLVSYVYGRPVGEPSQEVGGVMVTLAALCLAHGMDMHGSAETELARIWTKVEQIRAKQAAKPKHSPLPMVTQAKPEQAAQPHKGMTVAGNGAQELGALMREQWANRGGVYPDGNPNAGGKA